MLQLVEDQLPGGYKCEQKIIRKPLQFTAGRYEAAMKMEVDSEDATNAGWMITVESDDEVSYFT